MMQKVHLVVTYEDGDNGKLSMPDCIRTILKDTTESQIGDIPGMMEYRKVMESFTECNIAGRYGPRGWQDTYVANFQVDSEPTGEAIY